jgi:hypothetical protein
LFQIVAKVPIFPAVEQDSHPMVPAGTDGGPCVVVSLVAASKEDASVEMLGDVW